MPTYNIGRPKFVAHEGSVMLYGTGVQIDWATVTADGNGVKKMLSGTLLHIDPTTQLAQAADTGGTPDAPASAILVSDVSDTPGQNKGFHGAYVGGVFYENLMATPPTAGDKTALGSRFVFQVYADSRLD
ncbi:MAG: hypothetical protein H0U69_03685 [Trueperaceae bacterium]|nr:hypothetical protein [Trueperaceae bacterium]